MSISGIDFGKETRTTHELLQPLLERLQKEGVEPGFITSEIFTDSNFNDQFLSHFSSEEQYQYFKNTSLFETKLKKDKWLTAAGNSNTMFGKETIAPAITKENSAEIPPIEDKLININHIKESGMDPSKILVFRATQPSDLAKPENNWSSDYFETKRGLWTEFGKERRKSAIILVSNLEQICQGGAILDRNDSNGLSLRRIDSSPYDSKTALGKIIPPFS